MIFVVNVRLAILPGPLTIYYDIFHILYIRSTEINTLID